MADRNQEGYFKLNTDFIDHVLVRCPQCEAEAVVYSKLSAKKLAYDDIKVACAKCGFNKRQGDTSSRGLYSRLVDKTKSILIGAPVDPFFKLPLKLQELVNGNLLWAYNYEHLEFIRSIVEAKLRERKGSSYNTSVGSRLPRWLTSKSNRETALKVIERLKRKDI